MAKNSKIFALFSMLLFAGPSLVAQTDTTSLDNDQLFRIAREKAFNNDRETSRKYLKVILGRNPGYNEARTFLARTYAWDGLRDSARHQLDIVLGNNPKDIDALSARTDVELWDDKPLAALGFANRGLEHDPNSEELLLKKVRALLALNRAQEADLQLAVLLKLNPANKDANELERALKIKRIKNSLTFSYNVDFFSRIFDPAIYSFLQYGRKTGIGWLYGRGNYSERFNSAGWQGEIDFYPTIAKGMYLYLNYGYSMSGLFPRHRAGAEFYFKLPKSFEASVGLRYLNFSTSSVNLYTATLGKYFGNYWFSARTFITPGGAGTSNSYIFQVRRYFSSEEDYIGLTGAFGFSPDFRSFIQSGENPLSDNIITLRSRRVGIDFQKLLGYRWLLGATFNISQQEYIFDIGNYIVIYNGILSLQYRF